MKAINKVVGAGASDNTRQNKERLVHEHDFVPITLDGPMSVVRCISCDAYYCRLCGKLLKENNYHNNNNCILYRYKI
jgi:hypothetical protein